MRIYRKYLLKILLKYFFLTLFILTSLIWITRTIKFLDYITEYGLDIKTFIKIVSLLLPNLLLITIPLSLFVSIIFSYNKLLKNNELIILQNFGIKKLQLLLTTFFLALFATCVCYLITLYISPKSNIEFKNMKSYMKNNITNLVLTNTDFNTFKNITFYAKEKINNNTLKFFNIYIKGDNGFDKNIYAKTAEIYDYYAILRNGYAQEFELDKDDLKTIFFDEYVFDISQYYNVDIKVSFDEKTMFIDQLLMVENKKQEIIGEIANMILTPLISITLSILAATLILNIKFTRMENNKDLLICYIICLFNFSIFLYCMKIAEKSFNGIRFSLCIIILPIIYSLVSIKRNKNV